MTHVLLNTLLEAKGEICVSIIVPTHKLSHGIQGDRIEVKKAVATAKEDLKRHASPKVYEFMASKIDHLVDQIDFTHNEQGVGIFVSPSVAHFIKFPYPVVEKIVVSNSFEIRDVAYAFRRSGLYYVLVLSEKTIHIYQGTGEKLTEINDNDFPDEYTDTFEYQKPSRASSYVSDSNVKAFEKDKTELEKIRMHNFFRIIDKRLGKYLAQDIPLIVAAPLVELSIFEKESNHKKQIIGTIKGNYTHQNSSEISKLAYPKYVEYINNRDKQLVSEYQESVGYNRGVAGAHAVWQAAREGRGLKLLVEKDYIHEGYLHGDENKLLLKTPFGAHKVIVDVVDDIAETVLEKQGEVYFVDNGILADYGRIALILRY